MTATGGQGPGAKHPACTGVVPFYNERERVLQVLRVLTRVQHLARIVGIDDGSEDGTGALLAEKYPEVVLLRLERNRGKSAAIAAGLSLVRTSHVLLADADLQDLEAVEVEAAVGIALADPAVDMIILRRVRAAPHARLSRGDVIFSGERVLKTELLRQVLASSPRQYQIEIAINQAMVEHGRTVYWLPSSARNTLKMRKRGLVSGFMSDLTMVKDMMDYAGLDAFTRQVLFFARDRYPGHLAPGDSGRVARGPLPRSRTGP